MEDFDLGMDAFSGWWEKSPDFAECECRAGAVISGDSA
jgi:hypothetical protein